MRFSRSKPVSLETPYSFQGRFQNIQRIVIIYPQQVKWLRIARYALQNMFNMSEQFEFLLFVPPESDHPGLTIQHEYEEMQYEPTEEAGLSINSRIAAFNPDALLQLEPEPGKHFSKLLNSLDIALKIGFGSESSGLNVILSQKEGGFYEKNILNLIALLNTHER